MDEPASKSDPQVKAKDRQTLEAAARENTNFGVSDANLSLARSVLGPGFSESDLIQAFRTGRVVLAAPSDEERQQWAELAEDERKLRLMNASTSELKQEVRQGFDQRRHAQAVAEADRVLAAKEEIDRLAGGFPELPSHFRGRKLDREFFVRKCSRDEMKFLVQKYGAFNVEKRIRGIS